jgi:predicted nuclease of predicted toxin-antitoxin system
VKLLFDQNISHRVVLQLQNTFTEAKHVRDFNLQFATDRQIWNFAKQNGFALVTFDSDFNDLATLFGHPPKIVWLRFGNTLTQNLVNKIKQRKEIITLFLTDISYSNVGCLEIDH